MIAMIENGNSSVYVASTVFILTSLSYIALGLAARTKSRDQIESKSVSTASKLTKQEVQRLRSTYFSSSMSVSYANSGALMIVKGCGSRLIDDEGKSYLDTRNNVAHCGHGNKSVVEAVQAQVETLNSNTRYLHQNVCVLAERLTNLLPDFLAVVFFVNSGSEANDLALRLARAYTGSKNTIVVDGGYHGHTIACLEVSPYKYEHSKEFNLSPPTKGAECKTPGKHIWKVPCPDVYRGPHRDVATAGTKYADYVRDACLYYTEEQGEAVGAFMVEGGMSVAGVVLPPKHYLQLSVKAVRDAGGVYIADEVQTGFGRLGTSFWAFQNVHGDEECVTPDIVTVGKPFGNGMPLGAVVTTAKIANAFEGMGVEYFNTFAGNPVCAAAGLAVLDEIENKSLQERAAKVGEYLVKSMRELQETETIIGDVRGSGLFIGIEFIRDRNTLVPASAETSFLCTILKQKYSVLTSIDGKYNNVLVVKPPLVFSMKDADELVSCLAEAIRTDLKSVQDVESMTITPT